MLRDDVELLSGRIVAGPLTPALFLLLKDTEDLDKFCKDLHIERSEEVDNPHRSTSEPGPVATGGFSLSDWLANNAQPVSL